MSDQRTGAAKGDLALLHVLGTAGLRRAEACALLIADISSAAAQPTGGCGDLHAIAARIKARPVIPAYSYRLLRISPGSLC